MKFDPIRATVSDQTITKVTRLFNGTLKDVLNELLQNARRAGANLVTVGARPDGNGLRITIEDDGCGIDDPAAPNRGLKGRQGPGSAKQRSAPHRVRETSASRAPGALRPP